ncbi:MULTISPECIES: hypothetical protein [Nocardioides]|uniref:Uncharacterized protein n=1 Tax=Nocardioides vastitatis TaxID=2568655 RepID=A0ABW0ZHU5_9ACTN|nr:hypothetical protein [Nocardioides sp.]THI91278.1 hypothetical protein E7Z54_22445 [Nocardioides sp.]
MDDLTPSSERHRRHLLSPQTVTRSADTSHDADLTRRHGQGNGVRMHSIYFAAVSLTALVLLIVAIAVATMRM